MTLYILRCPGSDFTGVAGGVDFYLGRGSTSSPDDAMRLAQIKNCGVSVVEPDGSEREVRLTQTAKGIAVEPSFIGNQSQAEGVGGPAPSAVLSTTAVQDALERNPDSEWSKRRAAAADAKKRKRRRKQ